MNDGKFFKGSFFEHILFGDQGPESPALSNANKQFYENFKAKIDQLQQLGENFIANKKEARYRNEEYLRIELGTQAKFLHRGFYCPSPFADLLISNAKRGKILKRPSERSNITHRFIYGPDDKLLFVDEFCDGRPMNSEYIIYCENIVYGITLDLSGHLQRVSEEHYCNNVLANYTEVIFSRDYEKNQHYPYEINHEVYHYDALGLCGCERYEIFAWNEKYGCNPHIRHRRYLFEREDGYLKRYVEVNDDGSVDSCKTAREIKLSRKA